MAKESNPVPQTAAQEEERVPIGQVVFDDIFLWLMAGLLSPFLFYLVWGLWETSVIPVFSR